MPSLRSSVFLIYKMKTPIWIFLAFWVGSLGLLAEPTSAWGESKLQKAPSFRLLTPDNQVVSLEDFSGKVIYLDFWGSWCPPCIEETPHLNAVHKAYQGRGFTVVGIAIGDSKASLKRYMQRAQVAYPVVVGDDRVVEDYRGVIFLPTAFLIDRQGFIRKKVFGYKEKEEIEQLILPLLEEQ